MIRGVNQLVQEIEAREEALARASSHAEEAIQRGATELSRQWSLFSIMWKGMENKNKIRQDKVAQREQQLAAREAKLVKEARDLELRREELKHEVKQRLAEVEKRHIVALDEKARDVRNSQQKETTARKAAEHGERGLHTEKETTRGLRDQAKLDGQFPCWRSPRS